MYVSAHGAPMWEMISTGSHPVEIFSWIATPGEGGLGLARAECPNPLKNYMIRRIPIVLSAPRKSSLGTWSRLVFIIPFENNVSNRNLAPSWAPMESP